MKPTQNLELVPVTEDNLALAVETAVEIFGEKDREGIQTEFGACARRQADMNAMRDELKIVNPHYYIAKRNGVAAGITGYYSIEGHEDEAWLGWMGVLPPYRRGGIGHELVQQGFAKAAEKNTRTFRIWTTLEDDYANARRLYTNMGFLQEPYRAGAIDGAKLITIFSKSARFHDDLQLWQHTGYPIDAEAHTIPELNAELGIGAGNSHAAESSPPADIIKKPGSEPHIQ